MHDVLYCMGYRHAKVATEVNVSKTVGPNIAVKVGLTTRERGGIAAINHGYRRRVGGVASDGIEGNCAVCYNGIVLVGEVQKLLHDEMVTSSTTGLRIQRMMLFICEL